jgi:hypothetical protein
MYDHIGAFVLLLLAAIMLAAGGIAQLRRNRQARDAAKRRHPSARTATSAGHNLRDFDSDAARRYHESNQFGR